MGLLADILDLIYPRSRYGRAVTVRSGVEVRSRAEARLARYFDSVGLRYEYEKELEARFLLFTQTVSHPDFYLPDYEVYVEYWGLLTVQDHATREAYTNSMNYKLARYQQLGIRCISLYPEDLKRLDSVFRRKFQEATGKELRP